MKHWPSVTDLIVRGLVILWGLLVSLTPGPYPGIRKLPASQVQIVPLPGPGKDGYARDVVAGLAPDGGLRVALATSVRDKSLDRVSELRITHDGTSSSPAVVLDSLRNAPRFARGAGDLQLFAWREGGGLARLVDDPRLHAWRNGGPVLRPSDAMNSYDVVALDSLIVVAVVGYDRPDEDTAFEQLPIKLTVIEIPSRGAIVYYDLAKLPHGQLGADSRPHLAVWHGEVHLVCAIGGANWSWILHAVRSTGGRGWSPMEQFDPVQLAGASGTIAMAATKERVFVFFATGRGIEGVESTDGRTWSPTVEVRAAQPWGAYDSARNFVATADSDAVLLAWMDRAIGGSRIPPIGMSNPGLRLDVLAIAAAGPAATLRGLSMGPLLRLTASSGEIAGIAATSGHGWHHVAWIRNDPMGDRPSECGLARIPEAAR